MKRPVERAFVVVAATAAVVVGLLLYVLINLWSLRQGYVEQIETITPRTARLLGIVQSADALIDADLQASFILEDVAYPAQPDAAATEAAMQRDVRELVTAAGLSVSGSQILPRQAHEGYERLVLDLTAEGNIDSLEQALEALEEMRPLVFVQSLSVKPARASRRRTRQPEPEVEGDTRRLTARFKLTALRLKG